MEAEQSKRILIADDDRVSREILSSVLRHWGYEVDACSDGEEALKHLYSEKTYAVSILDWMMPYYSGIEICEKLRKQKIKYVPYIIILTCRGSLEDVIKGLESGADDYLVKPFKPEELHARIRVGLRLASMQLEVCRYASGMEELAETRAQQLIHSDRLSTIGMLSAGMAHEINNPLSFIDGNIHFLKEAEPIITEALTGFKGGNKSNSSSPIDPKLLSSEFPRVLSAMEKGVTRIKYIIESLTLYAGKGDGKKAVLPVEETIKSSIDLCRGSLKSVDIQFSCEETFPALISAQQIEQVWVNIIINAVDAISSVSKPTIKIDIEKRDDDLIEVRVKDNGEGISSEDLGRIFNPFFTSKEVGKGTGLGLSICQGIIENHGGSISCESTVGVGTTFIIRLKGA